MPSSDPEDRTERRSRGSFRRATASRLRESTAGDAGPRQAFLPLAARIWRAACGRGVSCLDETLSRAADAWLHLQFATDARTLYRVSAKRATCLKSCRRRGRPDGLNSYGGLDGV